MGAIKYIFVILERRLEVLFYPVALLEIGEVREKRVVIERARDY